MRSIPPSTKKDIQNHLLACRAAGVAGIVRVPWNDHVFIKSVLDMGADGIIVPMVRSLEEARTAARSNALSSERCTRHGNTPCGQLLDVGQGRVHRQ